MSGCKQYELTKSILVGLFVHENKAGQYLGHYLSDRFGHLRRDGDLGIQVKPRNKVFGVIKEAYNGMATFAP